MQHDQAIKVGDIFYPTEKDFFSLARRTAVSLKGLGNLNSE